MSKPLAPIRLLVILVLVIAFVGVDQADPTSAQTSAPPIRLKVGTITPDPRVDPALPAYFDDQRAAGLDLVGAGEEALCGEISGEFRVLG